MPKIGIFGFGQIGKNFYKLSKDVGMSNCCIYDDFSTHSLICHDKNSLKTCDIIIICVAKKSLQKLFIEKLLLLNIPKTKIRIYQQCFYAFYWLENSIKKYFQTQNSFIHNLLEDSFYLHHLQKLLKEAYKHAHKPDKDSKFYDNLYLSSEIYTKDYQENIYYPGWKFAYEILENYGIHQVDVLDIGCGNGIFANMLYKKNIPKYIGIDFSPQAIKMAQNKTPHWKEYFIQEDIFSSVNIKKPHTHICLFEVLEHINKDLEILRQIPSHTHIIASVPNFYSQGHIRIFENITQIKHRYNHLIKFLDIFELHFKQGTKIFYFHALKR
ncbi:methyltransferase domain-containing protein [Helicobacter sp. 11S03491-1]|uniref:class I SAM-dependent methyltransferase n=1 Tax=Helicobacter sp. 11S03491-1 TaxID=1476196 RepID=UPI000BA568CF|nr:methyltransferase domain-containing protein [Helicobacter sp. 11S03491-1]PAF43011.1 hypothetical protein BKH45_02770 [Helicobacter sp. 11S03491-1]